MSGITSEVIVIILLIFANGLFAMAEIAVVSSRKARLQQRANEGDIKARNALKLTGEPNLVLSTTQVGITVIGIFAGAFGGATIANKVAVPLRDIPVIGRYSGAISLFVVVACITYLSLIVGELVPKRLALNNPERIAMAVANPMRILSRITAPLVFILSASTDIVIRLLGVRPSTEPPVTEEEIKVLIEQGTKAGMFEEAEQDMVERVFRLGDQRVSALFTPRTKIVWLDLEESLEENLRIINESIHSRFLVCRGDLDDVVGIIQVKDLFEKSIVGEKLDLKDTIREPLFVPETMRALRVLELFKQSGTHMALVIDEYSHVQGLITLNDIMEALVGDLPSFDEPDTPQIVKRDDGTWLVDGMMNIEEFKEIFNIRKLPGEERGIYQTLGGFVMMHMEIIPETGEHFEWNGFYFEVVDMDGNRVDKILVKNMRTGKKPVG